MNLVFAPSGFQASPEDEEVPNASLELEHIYGYNGNLPHNIAINADGSLVYAIAAVGVVVSQETKQQSFFVAHNEDITAFAAHPEGRIMATGQTDPKGAEKCYTCVWDSTTIPPAEVSCIRYAVCNSCNFLLALTLILTLILTLTLTLTPTPP